MRTYRVDCSEHSVDCANQFHTLAGFDVAIGGAESRRRIGIVVLSAMRRTRTD